MSKFNVTKLVVCLLILVMGLFAAQAFAQSQASTGQISGAVKDSAGAVIVGATIKLVNSDTGFTQVVNSGDSGFFRAVLLPPGNYKVTATQQGWRMRKTISAPRFGASPHKNELIVKTATHNM